jgi:hypothetical protein
MAGGGYIAGGKKNSAAHKRKRRNGQKNQARIHDFTLLAVSAMAVLHMAAEPDIVIIIFGILRRKDFRKMKRKKREQRSRDYGRAFFTFQGRKSSVPSGCVLAGIRYVAALAGMNNYLARTAPCGLLRQNSNAIVKYYGNNV